MKSKVPRGIVDEKRTMKIAQTTSEHCQSHAHFHKNTHTLSFNYNIINLKEGL